MSMITRRSLVVAAAACSGVAVLPVVARGRRGAEAARADLYQCEGCEAVEERDPAVLGPSTQLAGPDEPGERMILTGRVFDTSGRPAPNVVIYAHQTNNEGLYANGSDESEWSRRNGRLRGWVKTGADGTYTFDTIKPGIYPDRTMPAHVHLMIKEPGRRPYYIDDVVFDGEFGVDARYRARQELRGGSGIVSLVRRRDGVLIARRDIVLQQHP
jgi:protocatechuate 3,4-dioxygenase beta subunit